MSERTVVRIVRSERVEVAPGFHVHRAMPLRGFRGVDPFLLIDHLGPIVVAPGESHGVPAHPHCGFEPVTYLIHGQVRHRDSLGNDVVVSDGDVDWMTAGAGIIHSEMPPQRFQQSGGALHGFQIWVNLPARNKKTAARLQYTPSQDLPIIRGSGFRIKVLAGRYAGVASPIETFTPLLMTHIELQPATTIELDIPVEFNACLYIAEGEAVVGKDQHKAVATELVELANDGYTLTLANSSSEELSLLLLSGTAINEKVFSYGPFVMSSFEEIQQAIEDYESGKMGVLLDD